MHIIIQCLALAKYNYAVPKTRWSVKCIYICICIAIDTLPFFYLNTCKVLALGETLNNLCVLKRHTDQVFWPHILGCEVSQIPHLYTLSQETATICNSVCKLLILFINGCHVMIE